MLLHNTHFVAVWRRAAMLAATAIFIIGFRDFGRKEDFHWVSRNALVFPSLSIFSNEGTLVI